VGTAVDEYLARLPSEQRGALERLRQTVKSVVPESDEVIRTRVPAYRYRGKPLVSIGAAKRHLSLFIMYGGALKRHEDELKAFDTSNTVVRFQPDRPLPEGLVTKLVQARVAEIDAKVEGRSS
jgi:uncharacterized protein YdhG (YjbR/CyaY superfamily)